jgi:hypothetical protein
VVDGGGSDHLVAHPDLGKHGERIPGAKRESVVISNRDAACRRAPTRSQIVQLSVQNDFDRSTADKGLISPAGPKGVHDGELTTHKETAEDETWLARSLQDHFPQLRVVALSPSTARSSGDGRATFMNSSFSVTFPFVSERSGRSSDTSATLHLLRVHTIWPGYTVPVERGARGSLFRRVVLSRFPLRGENWQELA